LARLWHTLAVNGRRLLCYNLTIAKTIRRSRRSLASTMPAGLFLCPEGRRQAMPMKPKRPCRYPGCPNLCEDGEQYCDGAQGFDGEALRDVHARLLDRQTIRQALAAHPRPLRPQASPVRECLKQGRYVAVEEVHHIVPFSEGGTNDESEPHEPLQVMSREDPQGTRRPIGRRRSESLRGGLPENGAGSFCAKKAKSNGNSLISITRVCA
jgi:5-methylcytosine-specific restriction enzyme A